MFACKTEATIDILITAGVTRHIALPDGESQVSDLTLLPGGISLHRMKYY